jgi:hypothetical protein
MISHLQLGEAFTHVRTPELALVIEAESGVFDCVFLPSS